MDVWITQVGSGQFHNLTAGRASEVVNPSVRTLGFSPDGSLVTSWLRRPDVSGGTDISIWAVPTLGGQPRPYLEGVAEYDWSGDGTAPGISHARSWRPAFCLKGQCANDGSGISSLRRLGSTRIFRCGRQTENSSISFKVPYQTSWTSGVSLLRAGLRSASRRTIRA